MQRGAALLLLALFAAVSQAPTAATAAAVDYAGVATCANTGLAANARIGTPLHQSSMASSSTSEHALLTTQRHSLKLQTCDVNQIDETGQCLSRLRKATAELPVLRSPALSVKTFGFYGSRSTS